MRQTGEPFICYEFCGFFVPLYLTESPRSHSDKIDRLQNWVMDVRKLNACARHDAKWDNTRTSIEVVGLEWGVQE